MESDLGLVESLRVDGPRTARPRAESFSPDFQICLPYRGAFIWHVGQDDVVADANRVLMVAGGEAYRVSQPVDGGYAELIVTVPRQPLAERLGVSEPHLDRHPVFRQRSRRAAMALQRLGAECLHYSHGDDWQDVAGDEWMIAFLQAALTGVEEPVTVSPSTTRLLGRAKEYLAANLAASLRLTHVAHAIGTSPTYLTTVFRRLEGVPLHRYLIQLRLARALVEIPHTRDLTGLACELGFSNHSHFTTTFRRAFGCTPSRFRESMRHERILAAERASPAARTRR